MNQNPTKPAAPTPETNGPLPTITDIVDEEVDGYEMRGDDGDYMPTEHERMLLSDFAYGLIENKDLIAWLVRHHASPTAAPNLAQPKSECECPQHGRWLYADDVDRMVKELDVAVNGGKAAKQARLCDIVGELKEYIEAAKADVVVPAAQEQKPVASGVVAICPDCETPLKTCGCERKILDDYKAGKIHVLDAIGKLSSRIERSFASPAPADGFVKMDNPDYAQYLRKDWVMVPKVPTLEMQHAYMRKVDENRHRMDDHRDSYGWHDAHRDGYIAMLAAAPKVTG